ncbi:MULTISPECIES: flagellar filament capping protein FliD [Cupriavidus]|jgi:flagellar hook-associated protein 2|uniref:Flagellar hook-associated protein 2 n=1 Tax=Cupriavidus pauculus TaxID=82633 RepID=A0A5P2HE26_9BURK|nr:flagellar filament capping protein FliD [Cupriavidus pauculus]QET05864.1 flagellar filament capping protein FliD [Cupriavidus pauculus]
MAGISNIGVGSGLNLQDLLTSLQTNENLALTPIQDQATAYQAKLSAYGKIKNALDAYQAAAKNLTNPKTFSVVKAAVSNGILTPTTSTDSVPGSYAIKITKLAQAQTLASAGQASQTTAIGGGTITFDFGKDLATGGAPTSTKTVTIGSDTSLQGIRDSINKADVGVKASIVNDGSGTPYRLVLTSAKTGEDMSMRVSASDSAVSNVLAFDPTQATQPNGMQEKIKAGNAALTVNGIDIVSQENTVKDAVPGTTLALTATGDTTLTTTQDNDAIKKAVTDFVSAYNALLTEAATQTAFDTSANKPGDPSSSSPLTGDATLRNIQTSLRSMLNAGLPDGKGGTLSLSQLGISFDLDTSNKGQNYGKLKVNDDKLDAAIRDNASGMSAFFGGVNGSKGLGNTISDYVDGLNADGGALNAVTTGLTDSLKDLNDKYTQTQDRIQTTMDRYKAQFTALDALVAQLNQTKSYLTQQFASLSSSNK